MMNESTMTRGQINRKNRKSSMLSHAEKAIEAFTKKNPSRVYFTVNEIWSELTPQGKKIIARKGTLTFVLGRLYYPRINGFLATPSPRPKNISIENLQALDIRSM